MCIFSAPKPTPMSAPPAVAPRQDKDTPLQGKRVIDTEDAKADIAYGTGQKQAGPAAGIKQGTDQLRIHLNTGGEATGSKTGGLNV